MPVIEDALSRFVRCPRFVALFPSGMPVRACLRRQVELRALKDARGEIRGWEPVHEGCIGCRAGLENLKASGAYARSCSKCGAGVVSLERRAACSECEEVAAAEHPTLPLRAPPKQDLLWTEGAVPDVPIGPPPATSRFSGFRPAGPTSLPTDPALAARAERRRREEAARLARGEEPAPAHEGTDVAPSGPGASEPGSVCASRTGPRRPVSTQPPRGVQEGGTTPAPVAPVNTETPARPAEDRTMPAKCEKCDGEVRARKGKITQPCRRCRQGKGPKAERASSPPAAAKVAKLRPGPKRLAAVAGDLEGKTVDELVDERDQARQRAVAITEELKRRRDAIDDAIGPETRQAVEL